MRQFVRTLTIADSAACRVLICDREAKWVVRERLEAAAIRVVQTRCEAPTAYAERFVRSIKEECLDRMIPLGEQHFRQRRPSSLRIITVRGIIKVSRMR